MFLLAPQIGKGTHTHTHTHTSFPGGSDGKESACNVGDLSSMPVLGRSPGEGQGYPSSIVAWRIPWTEEPSGLWSIGLQELDTSEWLTFHLSYIYIKVKQIHQKKKKQAQPCRNQPAGFSYLWWWGCETSPSGHIHYWPMWLWPSIHSWLLVTERKNGV